MKKLLSIVLAMAMVLALGVTAFAADSSPKTVEGNAVTDANADASIDVSARYNEGAAGAVDTEFKVYYVTISWTTDATAAYTAEGGDTYKWNPASLKYDAVKTEGAEAGWNNTYTQVTVTITNRSNGAVTIEGGAFTPVEGVNATVEWSDPATAASAAMKDGNAITNGTDIGAETTATLTLKVTPTAGAISEGTTSIGTASVVLSASN